MGSVRVSGGLSVSTGETNGKAVASLICGIGGFVFFPVLLSILAIILGRSAKREIAQRPGEGGEGLATAGIVLGWVGVALAVVGLLLVVAVFSAASHS